MEYQKIITSLDNESIQPSKFRKKKIGLKRKMNQEVHSLLIAKSNLKHHC